MFTLELTMETGSDVPGSYVMDIQFDPAVVTVASVDGGLTPAFAAAPVTNPASFASGTVTLVGAQASALSPSGTLSVARVNFQAVGAPGAISTINLSVVQLYDGDTFPLVGRAFSTSVQLDFANADDADGDGLSNLQEANAGTDINNADTDGDLLNDSFEVNGGLDPLDDGTLDFNQGGMGDPDGDQLNNLAEQSLGTNPTVADTDQDGLDDGVEFSLMTDPTSSDSDGDGLNDGFEVSNGLDPLDNGSVNINNGPNGDPDSDGVKNIDEFILGTDPNNPDTDGDGLPDGFEFSNGLDALDNGDIDANQGADGDPDGDGFSNALELAQNSNPLDIRSQPVNMVVSYVVGAQLVYTPIPTAPGYSTFDLLTNLNSQDPAADEVQVIGADNQIRITTWNGTVPQGDDVLLVAGQGALARFDAPTSLPYVGQVNCGGINLNAGSNIFGLQCVPLNETAFDLLERFGNGNATLLQRINPQTSTYESVYFGAGGAPEGTNFAIRRGEAYVINLVAPLTNFDPLP